MPVSHWRIGTRAAQISILHKNIFFATLKMYLQQLLLTIFLMKTQASLLMWGTESIRIPSLKRFDNEDFDLLKDYLRNPTIVAFKGDPWAISDELEGLLKNKYTAYVPNSDLIVDDVIDLSSDSETNFKTIEDKLSEKSGENVLAVILSTGSRNKRSVGNTTDITPSIPTVYVPPSGPILYNANGNAMLYSAKPPILKINTTSIPLGKAVFTSNNFRNKYSKFSVNIPTARGVIVILRFKFYWNAGYWSLVSVDVETDGKTYPLAVNNDITAGKNFSYHCTGNTLFTNEENDLELTIFDLQVQPYTINGRFNDAYDCVLFTTAPIWSGLFVSSILIIVLFIGLGALNSIKTMDKFDNYKTKQLGITVAE